MNVSTASNERRVSHASEVAEYYGAIARQLFSRSWYKDPSIVEYISNKIPLHSRRIVDLCSGTGSLVRVLLRKSRECSYDMVDISESICAIAMHRFASNRKVSIFKGNWIEPVVGREPYDTIIIKNALHLIPDLIDNLRALRYISKRTTNIILVETVSPNVRSNLFVQKLFKIAHINDVKLYFFTERSLKENLSMSGLVVKDISFIDQHISVDSWLTGKMASQLQRRMVLQFLRTSMFDEQLKKDMSIKEHGFGGDITLLRRQLCAELHF